MLNLRKYLWAEVMKGATAGSTSGTGSMLLVVVVAGLAWVGTVWCVCVGLSNIQKEYGTVMSFFCSFWRPWRGALGRWGAVVRNGG